MPGVETARTIDIHAHAVLEETFGAAGRFGPELGADDAGKPWFRIGDYKLHGVRAIRQFAEEERPGTG